MRVFWSVLAVIALSATEALAANWNKATVYPPESLVDQLKRGTVSQRELGEPAPSAFGNRSAEAGQTRFLRCCKHRLRRSLERRH